MASSIVTGSGVTGLSHRLRQYRFSASSEKAALLTLEALRNAP